MEVIVVLRESEVDKISLVTLRKALLLKELPEEEDKIFFEILVTTNADGSMLEKPMKTKLPATEVFNFRFNDYEALENKNYYCNKELTASNFIVPDGKFLLTEEHFSGIELTTEAQEDCKITLSAPYLIKDKDQHEFLYLVRFKMNSLLQKKYLKENIPDQELQKLFVLLDCFFSRDYSVYLTKEKLERILEDYLSQYSNANKYFCTAISFLIMALGFDSVVWENKVIFLRVQKVNKELKYQPALPRYA
jgi:hypothetical protein